jgi:ribonuclease Z
MGVDVVVLGSGSPLPDPERAGPALAVVGDAGWVLVDCGRAATQRAIDAGLDLTAVVAVALTHHHSDHVSDLATLATARWVAGATTPLVVVAPEGPSASVARRCLDPYDDQSFHGQSDPAAGPRPVVDVQAFDPGSEPAPVLTAGDWRVSSVLVDHHPVTPAVGYLVEHTGAGARVAVSGDTAVCDGMRALGRNVDVLVHQALLTSRVSPELLEWNAGAAAVGGLAAEVEPGILVLTHLIPAPRSVEHQQRYLDEVRAGGFAGSTLVAHDGLRITVAKY